MIHIILLYGHKNYFIILLAYFDIKTQSKNQHQSNSKRFVTQFSQRLRAHVTLFSIISVLLGNVTNIYLVAKSSASR